MMKISRTWSSLFMGIMCFSVACNPADTVELEKNAYFDLKGMIADQVNLLDSLRPSLQKEAIIDGRKEDHLLQPDSAGWAREMEIFLLADINKPDLRGSYKIIESNEAETGNRVTTYLAKEKKKLGIEYVKVSRIGDELAKVEMLYTEENVLYQTFRKLEMHFEPGTKRLFTYHIDGQQKMILKDTVSYAISGNLIY